MTDRRQESRTMRDWDDRRGGPADRRLAINAARRELEDELDRLDGRLGILRAAKTRAIVRTAMAAEFERGRISNETEKEAGRLLAYDSIELERRYTW